MPSTDSPDDARQQAIASLKGKREFTANVVSFVFVNLFMWGIWAATGMGYPWPIWVTGPWLIGMGFHAWQVYGQKPITDADIDAEMRKQAGH
jgi:hypothetical protein